MPPLKLKLKLASKPIKEVGIVKENDPNQEAEMTILETDKEATKEEAMLVKSRSKLAPGRAARDLFLRAKEIGESRKSTLDEEISQLSPVSAKSTPKKKARKIKSKDNVEFHSQSVATSQIFKIKTIILGNFAIDTWYSAPYPEEYANEQVLYNCEFCLKYMRNAYTMHRHKIKCGYKRPPGDEIYRDGKISVFEVDGRKNRIYCQNLCLMAKMFLDHKTLYYDVEPFLFYVLTEVDEDGCHLAGYFSKEKSFERKYNLSCILTLPHHQRKGFGTFLIDLSYLLSKKEKRLGTPEKPLSDLGLLSYKAYWKLKIYLYLESILNRFSQVSIMDICEKTSMESMDVKDTLLECKILIKSDENNYELHINQHEIINYLAKIRQKGLLLAIPEKLRWSPYLVKNFDNTTNQNDDELLIKF